MTCLDLSNKEKYYRLLEYVLTECDEITFHFPILDEKAYNTGDLAVDYNMYINKKKQFLEELFNHGATREITKVYQGVKLGYETQVIRVRLYPKLIEKIKKHYLYNWLWWNGLPEDPCFFSKKKCRFVTISHEEIFYVCDDKKDCEIIRQMQ